MGEAHAAHKVDAKAPVLESASYLGSEVELIYDEALDASSTPGKAAYTLEVKVDGTDVTPAITIDSVTVSGATVTLDLSAEAGLENAAVTLAYAVPMTNPVQDAVGNDAPAFAAMTLELGEQLRLVKDGQVHPSEGRLEARYQGEWGTVCDHYWTDIESDLVCRLLGHAEGSTGNGGRFLGAHFGEGTGKIWLDNVVCTGAEKLLSDCARRRNDPGKATPALGESNCSHAQDVGVQCKVSDTASAPEVTGAPGLSDAPGGDAMWGPGERLEGDGDVHRGGGGRHRRGHAIARGGAGRDAEAPGGVHGRLGDGGARVRVHARHRRRHARRGERDGEHARDRRRAHPRGDDGARREARPFERDPRGDGHRAGRNHGALRADPPGAPWEGGSPSASRCASATSPTH